MKTLSPTPRHVRLHRQGGMALVATLMILMVVTLLAVTATRTSTQEERMARGTRDRQVALQAAEAALVDARQELFSSNGSLRSLVFSGATSFTSDCGTNQPGSGNVFRGLCLPATPTAGTPNPQPAWITYMGSQGVQRGTFARINSNPMPALATGGVAGVAAQPSYLIEVICSVSPGDPLRVGAACQRPRYRITARGFGPNANSTAWVQESVRLQ